MGNPVGNVFKIDTYTRMIQEIKATDIHDFNAEQVVNFDESEKTNFLVLNENTVKAESSENENTLVSADYDNNTFVFDNIDDTVKNLKEGEYFYIQPSKDDIIAVSVDNISIDGDQATISGNNNIDDMFDFVKFETTTDMNNVTVDTTESDENFIFPDKKGDEKQFTYETGKPIEFCADAKRLLKYKSETSFTLSMDREKGSLSEAFGDGSPLSFKGSIEFKSSINFYKSCTKTSFGFSLTVDFNCALSLEGDNDLLSESSFTGSDAVQSWAKKQTQDIKAKIADINIPTSIPGVLIGIEPELVLKISGSLTLKFSYAPIVGFTYSTDDGFQNISQFSTDQCDATLNMQGEVFVGLVLNPGIEIVSRKIAYASFDITAGVSITIEGELSLRDSIAKICGDLSADKKVAVVNKNDDSIHACDVCFNGHVALKLAYGLTLSVMKKDIAKGLNKEITIPADFLDFHISFPHLPCLPKFGKGECSYNKYNTTFVVKDSGNGGAYSGAEVIVDGLSNYTNDSGKATFFCDNGSYKYTVKYGSETIKSGSFTVDNAKQTINVNVNTTTDKDGNTKITGGNSNNQVGPRITTPPVQTRVKHSVTTVPLAKNENQNIAQAKQLGDNIIGRAYPDGYVYIYGHGDMYDFSSSPFDHPENIKSVIFENTDPEKGLVITGIGNCLFYGAKNLDVIYWSNDIKRIGNYAFYNCNNLKYLRYNGEKDVTKTFVLPTALTNIGNYAFYGCGLAAFNTSTIPASVKTIGRN